MTNGSDPFAHHPELRAQIKDFEKSFFRTARVETMIEQFPELEEFREWVYSDDEREAIRAKTMAGHRGDLWVFAYGSLMWDPALKFAEVRRAHAPGCVRKMILFDDKGGRGTKDAPGLMAALDVGDGCDGLVFRIAAPEVEAETEILFRREVIAPGYIPAFVQVQIDDGMVDALTFLADHDTPDIRADLPREDQVRYIATGTGILGTSREYLANIVAHFDIMGIEDDHCATLLKDVDAFLAGLADQGSDQ